MTPLLNPSVDIWEGLGTFLVLTQTFLVAPCIEARDATRYPTMHTTSFSNREFSAQKVNKALFEEA